MRSIKFIQPIESMQGKLCAHSGVVFNLGQHGQNQGRQWWQVRCKKRNLNLKPMSSDELAARARFKAVRKAVETRMASSTRDQDMAAMKAANFQGSFRQYIWLLEGDKYDQNL